MRCHRARRCERKPPRAAAAAAASPRPRRCCCRATSSLPPFLLAGADVASAPAMPAPSPLPTEPPRLPLLQLIRGLAGAAAAPPRPLPPFLLAGATVRLRAAPLPLTFAAALAAVVASCSSAPLLLADALAGSSSDQPPRAAAGTPFAAGPHLARRSRSRSHHHVARRIHVDRCQINSAFSECAIEFGCPRGSTWSTWTGT
ncbi:hypothetical protein Scep_002211 [Stephania cephalantha]|uniref:Uncharacterized protein n=1 Tax=Stephania cephalantha TaxID=152367 RepID=A0AAP0Q4G1_9MAGN